MVRVFILCLISFQFIIKYLLTIWISLLLEFLSFEIFELIYNLFIILLLSIMDFTFNIVQRRQQITLMLDDALLLEDVAGYLYEEKYT